MTIGEKLLFGAVAIVMLIAIGITVGILFLDKDLVRSAL